MPLSQAVDDRPTVLVVEDDDWLRDVVADILESSGYRVATARNGWDAREYLATVCDPPSAVLMDLMMPIVSGWEFLAGFRSEERFAATPIVVMTALDDTMPSGVDLVLRKPFRIDDLVATIDHFARAAVLLN
jgi:DNA-binding response OmpR family regulator